MPTFMAVGAMPGAYPAPFESHNSARYVARFLQLVGPQLDPAVVGLLQTFIRYVSGVTRHAYPDRLPPALLSATANGAGPALPFRNNASMPVPVEDLNWDWTGPTTSGAVGQEIYGSIGAAADFALLASEHGACSSVA
jgi:hypothetical protein